MVCRRPVKLLKRSVLFVGCHNMLCDEDAPGALFCAHAGVAGAEATKTGLLQGEGAPVPVR